jgi:polysaccharide deacetylase 2 family uncharacterized protein YibQ
LAKRNRSVKINRKKNGGRRPLVSLLIIVTLIILVFYLLEKLKKPVPEKPVVMPPPVAHKKPPSKAPKPPVVQKHYTTAVKVTPPAKPPVITPPVTRTTPKPLAPIGHGTVAIIIDDMGSSVQEVEALTAINVPLTFSIIPGLAKSRQVAEVAHDKGHEVMIHMPMEPKDYPKRRLEKNGLLLAESDDEIGNQVKEYLCQIPYAVGANNHMGSRFTEDEGKMRDVMQVLKGRGLFFIDSMTSPGSVGRRLAGEMGVRTAARNVFLDNVQDVAAIRKQIEQLARLSVKRGGAIGICHPHKATIQALAVELPILQREGITFVYASKLVR